MASLNISLIRPLGYQRSTSCGYCKKSEGNSSYYISCEKLRVEHYQELVNRGWRRSGTTYYKPDLTRSCCPHYTIRLDASSFKPTRDQRKALHRLNRYVIGPEYSRKAARLCPVSRKEKRETRDKFDLISSVHAAELSNIKRPVDPSTKKPIEPAHKFEVTLETADFSTEKYDLFLKYQLTVHKELKSRWSHQSHKRWLCGGLERKTSRQGGQAQKLGTHHQCYRLDGKLIAVGVLDLMPQCVSSVYLFYDPKYEHWQLGKLSAMREIALAVEGHYQYYYMGYYIHNCVKMRYKGAYSPSYLLDPEILDWNVLDNEYRKQLDRRLYYAPSSAKTAGSEKGTCSETTKQSSDAHEVDTNNIASAQVSSEAPDGFELDSEGSEDGTEIPEGSLFNYNIPGVLKLEEVEKLDLDHWKLLVRKMLVDFEDLKGWEKSSMTDPQSLKGIAAELAAALGPKVVKESVVVLF